MSDKIYIGNGKERQFNNGGSIIRIMLDVDTLAKHFKEHGFTTEGGKRMIPINIGQNREVDRYGNTHNASIDTWKPEKQPIENASSGGGNVKFEEDIPF